MNEKDVLVMETPKFYVLRIHEVWEAVCIYLPYKTSFVRAQKAHGEKEGILSCAQGALSGE